MIRLKHTIPILLAVMALHSCQRQGRSPSTLFTLMPVSETKIDFVNRLTETEEFNMIKYLYFNNGAGVGAGDINNDGLVDLYFSSSQESNRLYLNKGALSFEEITRSSGTRGTGAWKTGVSMADVNGDGWLDIYVCQVGGYQGLQGKNQLFINQGDLTFREEAAIYNLDFRGYSTQAAFFDYDLDGDLDMYLLNHSVHTSRSYGMAALREQYDEKAGDRLFRNNLSEGDPSFTDVSREAGIFSSQIGYGLGVSASDINNDGFPDIYISNDFHENDYLYLNNGDGTFTEQLTRMMRHTSRSSMGNDVADINNDGLPDVVVLDMLPDEEKILKRSGGEDDYELFNIKLEYGYSHQFVRNTLQLNLGGGSFSEIGRYAGIHATDWSWSPLLCDLDNDGWKDLFITNGIYRRANDLDYVDFLTGGNRYLPVRDNSSLTDRELYEKMPLYSHVNFIYRNNGDLTFTNMAGSWGIRNRSYSNGSVYADLDNDGDLDLVVNNINQPASVWENHGTELTGNHYLSVVLKGDGLNPAAVGARVTIYSAGQKQMSELFTTRGFMSATSPVLHFGLGTASMIDSLEVRWPDRSLLIYRGIQADQRLTIVYGETTSGDRMEALRQHPVIFTAAGVPGLDHVHLEDPYTDLERESLIPHSLSAEGPAVAVGDVNGDGREDLFMGGAAGQPAALLIQQQGGTLLKHAVELFNHDRLAEDVDAVFFDADGDGDLDLYVVRGGNEFPEGDPMLADRLMINDGKGNFSRSDPGSIPYMASNGSCVRPCDFDADGDTDLFVGTRSVPGAYGIPPDQHLLENDGTGKFGLVNEERVPALKGMGMVTDACWVDDDRDGYPDLVIAGEWMPITLLSNRKGSFVNATLQAGLGETSGWWNRIKSVDVDGDGDMDLVGGNLGLNSMLKASPGEPVELFVNDFDNNGMPEPILCTYREGTSYPIATLDELERQMPGLKQRFESYAAFAGQTVQDIFGSELIANSYHASARMLGSALFLNIGDGMYTISALPAMAQFSPVRGVVSGDLNRDGAMDLVLAGNNYHVRPSIGRYDASYGLCLLGDGKGNFVSMLPVESGLKIEGDARGLHWIQIGEQPCLVTPVNNGKLQLFRAGI
jgi:hypothetical protein